MNHMISGGSIIKIVIAFVFLGIVMALVFG
jgi:hypothetical protein